MNKSATIIFFILLIDQILKFWIKLHMRLGESIHIIGDKIQLYFIENNGMAFGMQLSGNGGKVVLTLFRVVVAAAILVMIYKITRQKQYNRWLILSLSLIVAGALGNIVDSLFYGIIFSESTFTDVATLFPAEGGYSSFLQGKVVDMFYCPVIRTTLPQWVPVFGGKYMEFFRPIFNVADSAITIGMFILLFGYRKFFVDKNKENDDAPVDVSTGNDIKIEY